MNARIDTLRALRDVVGQFSSHGISLSGGKDMGGAVASAADFEITKEGRTALVHCKRWKVAPGVDALSSCMP
jgi:hypothetical protein